jgi:arylamine N-acetyltransferase
MAPGERGDPDRPEEPYDRYLALLGVARRPPGVDALRELVAAQVARVPFENVSKLFFRHDPVMRLPPLSRHLDGIARLRCGGTCYANNIHFVGLLGQLGYDVRLCGADMAEPDVHVVGIVRLAGREYLVDGGYAAPFLEPLPLDSAHDVEVELGDDRWVLKPRDDRGRPRIVLIRRGREKHGYVVNPAARQPGEFASVIEASFRADATFMNALLVAQFAAGRSRVLHNVELLECDGRQCRRSLVAAGPDALPDVVESLFGIPNDVARAALDGLSLTADAWS